MNGTLESRHHGIAPNYYGGNITCHASTLRMTLFVCWRSVGTGRDEIVATSLWLGARTDVVGDGGAFRELMMRSWHRSAGIEFSAFSGPCGDGEGMRWRRSTQVRYVTVGSGALEHLLRGVDSDDLLRYNFQSDRRQACPTSNIKCNADTLVKADITLEFLDYQVMKVRAYSRISLGC